MFSIEKEKLRDDLILRKEVKFVLHNADTDKMRIFLETHFKRIIYNKPVSVVRSVYFDDWSLSSCKANLDGVGQRKKLRLRWYDKNTSVTEFFFEIKIRNNNLTGKRRLKINSEKNLLDINYKNIVHGIAEKLPEVFLPVTLQYPESVLIVEYKREHFISFEKSIRITLDYDITFYDQTYTLKPKFSFGRAMNDMTVLECKLPAKVEQSMVKSLLFPLNLRPSRCSKYVHGCHYLNLLNSVY